jgi:F-type H+-transporting ATPase subunit b
MPQLDSTYFGPQLFWLFVCFALLFLGIQYFILPRFDKIFKARKKVLDHKLLQIQDLETEAEEISMEARLRLKEVQEESKKVLAEVRSELSKEIIETKAQLSKESTEKFHSANKDIKKEIDKLIESIEEQKATMAAMVLERVLGRKIDEKECQKIVEKRFHDN